MNRPPTAIELTDYMAERFPAVLLDFIEQWQRERQLKTIAIDACAPEHRGKAVLLVPVNNYDGRIPSVSSVSLVRQWNADDFIDQYEVEVIYKRNSEMNRE